MNDADTGYAPERWAFDEEVSRVFDDMLDRSIPQYETMRQAVTLVASASMRARGRVLDLGCARGGAIADLIAIDGDLETYFRGLEISEPMLAAADERFRDTRLVEVLEWDLRRGLPKDILSYDVILSVLTLMFVPTTYRLAVLADAFHLLRPGGSLVLVEKIIGETRELDDLFAANYHAKKARSGYTPDEIERKRLSLEGVLVPLTAAWNEDLLRAAGFGQVDCFWRWMNFAGWVARA